MTKKNIVVHPGCGYCEGIKTILDPQIKSGEIGVIDASTPDGMAIAKANNLDSVPNCLELQDDGTYKACSIEDLLPKVPKVEAPKEGPK